MAAVRFLVAIRLGFSAVCLRKRLRLRVGASGIPIRLLVNRIAGVDMHVGAFRFVVRLKSILGLC